MQIWRFLKLFGHFLLLLLLLGAFRRAGT